MLIQLSTFKFLERNKIFESERKNEIKLITKRNKEFNNKCSNLYHHIKILKQKEENYRKKLLNLKKKEKKDLKINEDKKKMKLQLEKKRKEKDKELQKRKENIKKLKNEEHNMLKETKNNNINNKRQRYQSALYDKRMLKNIKQEIDEQEKNKNYFLHEKIKQQYYEGKTNQLKKSYYKKNEEFIEQEYDLKRLKIMENKMMKTYNKLEIIEKKFMENINLFRAKEMNEKLKKKNNVNMIQSFELMNKKDK
jgi:hypothetical protein